MKKYVLTTTAIALAAGLVACTPAAEAPETVETGAAETDPVEPPVEDPETPVEPDATTEGEGELDQSGNPIDQIDQ